MQQLGDRSVPAFNWGKSVIVYEKSTVDWSTPTSWIRSSQYLGPFPLPAMCHMAVIQQHKWTSIGH